MAALLPLAEPFICTSSWFICFTQSSITGLKLGAGQKKEIFHYKMPSCILGRGETRRLGEALASPLPIRLDFHKGVKSTGVFYSGWNVWYFNFSTERSVRRRLNCTFTTCLAASNRSRRTVPQSVDVTSWNTWTHVDRVLTDAHLEPKTPLSSSSTVLSLFCSSFSRSLASASSCHREKDLLQHHRHSETPPHTPARPPNACFTTVVVREVGWWRVGCWRSATGTEE